MESPPRRAIGKSLAFATPEQVRRLRAAVRTASPLKAPSNRLSPAVQEAAARIEKRSEIAGEAEEKKTEDETLGKKSKGGNKKVLTPPPSKTAKNPALLKELYSFIRKRNGQLGGGGAGGAIYGEITCESFQRVVNFLVEKTGFGGESVFMDVGAGLGKPNFHVAVEPGVQLSLGVEIVGGRWWQSMHLMHAMLQHQNLGPNAQNCFLAHADICQLSTLDPVTHVYSFNKGFPPQAMQGFAKAFNASSTARYLIVFDKEAKVSKHGFNVRLVGHVNTKMEGSGEQNRCFVYERCDAAPNQARENASDVKPTKKELTPKTSPIKTVSRRRAASKTVLGKLDFDSDKPTRVAPSSCSIAWSLVAPPTALEFAPHVPHGATYLSGLEAMLSLDTYVEWCKDQVGFERCTRRTRGSRK